MSDRCVDCGKPLHGHGIRCRECAEKDPEAARAVKAPVHMGDVVAIWHKREDGTPASRWNLDDLWRAACSLLSANEAGAIGQRNVAEYHHREARKSLDLHNATIAQ